MKMLGRSYTVLLILLLAASPQALSRDAEPSAPMRLYAENECLRLYVNEDTAEIAVWDKRGQAAWYSNPPDREADPLANDLNRALLGSQLRAEVYSPRDQLLELNSLENSVKKRIFSISRLTDGARVEYGLNNHQRGEADIPLIVERKRFESRFLARMNEEQKREFLSRFELDEQRGAYLRRSIPQYKIALFLDILDSIDYSPAELQEDNRAAGDLREQKRSDLQSRIPGIRTVSLAQRDEVQIFVALEYRLEGADLVVSLDAGSIRHQRDYPLYSLEILRCFAAAGAGESGYIFVPDGSGALIYLNNDKHNYPPVSLPVYGDQEMELQKERLLSSRQVFLPVFGLKSGDRAFIGIVEQGEAVATINADVSGRLHSYNTVGVEFHITEKGRVTIGTGERARSRLVFQKSPYAGPIRIRYSFLYGEEADYLGMADRLRRHLQSSGVVGPATHGEPLLNLQLIGAIDLPRTFAGFSFRTVQAMTTYRQVVELADLLLSRGVDNLRIRYRGWLSGGLHHPFASEIRFEKRLGGEEDFRYMLAELGSRGVELWPEVSVGYTYLNGGGFMARRDAERYLDQSIARRYSFDRATFQRDLQAPAAYYLSPRLIPIPVGRVARFAEQWELAGAVLGQLGSQIRADYRGGAEWNRQRTCGLVKDTLEDTAPRFNRLAVSGANLPVIGAVDQLYDLPFYSSEFNICDESIPFLQLVLRGYFRFTGEPLNLSGDYRDQFLKTLETGADLQFLWTFQRSSAFKNTNFDSYYSTHYQASLEQAVGLYEELSEVRRRIGAARLTGHRRILPDVYELIFDNGIVLVINYNRQMITYRGLTVNGQDYRIVDGQ